MTAVCLSRRRKRFQAWL